MLDDLITALYKWCTTIKDKSVIKDTTNQYNIKFDAYIDSSISDPLSFTVFELSKDGELIIDGVSRLVESRAAFYLFVNPSTGWIFAVKNTTENQKKLIRKEPIQNFKIKINQ